MAASAAASVVWLTLDASVAPVSAFDAALAAPALAATFVSFAALPAAWDSDFLFVTEAFDCTGADCLASAFKDFSGSLSAAALEVDLTAGLAAAFGSGRETALGAVLFVDFTLATSAPAFGLAVCLADAAPLAVVTTGLAALLAEAGFTVFVEDVGVLAGVFIAFALESTNDRICFCGAETTSVSRPFPHLLSLSDTMHTGI